MCCTGLRGDLVTRRLLLTDPSITKQTANKAHASDWLPGADTVAVPLSASAHPGKLLRKQLRHSKSHGATDLRK